MYLPLLLKPSQLLVRPGFHQSVCFVYDFISLKRVVHSKCLYLCLCLCMNIHAPQPTAQQQLQQQRADFQKMKCMGPKCSKRSSFNFDIQQVPKFCEVHKYEGMVDQGLANLLVIRYLPSDLFKKGKIMTTCISFLVMNTEENLPKPV